MIYFIVNVTSRTGHGAEVWYKIRDELKKNKISYKAYETKYAGHAKRLAEAISSRQQGDVCIVVVGGDGTVNEVVNGISDFENVRFGVISGGSGNDFGRGIGVQKDPVLNLKDILRAAEEGAQRYQRIDLGRVSWKEEDGEKKERLFAISSGIGLDAIVCKRALTSKLKNFLNIFHLGKLTYLMLTVHTLFSMETADVDVEASNGGEGVRRRQLHKMIFMAAMNLKAEGGGVPMAPRASFVDGKLSCCSASGVPKWLTFLYLPFLVAAKHEKLPGFLVQDAQMVSLRISEPMVLHADGEYCGETKEAEFECLKGKLKYLA